MTDYRNGHAPFPQTLVISSERSGLNLVRHAVEVMSGMRTPGKAHLVKDGPLLFHRTHYAGHAGAPVGPFAPLFEPGGASNYAKALLLLRDPAETYVRAYDSNINFMKRYIENIQLFDRFQGDKLVVSYDELVSGNSALQRIFSFLSIENHFDASRLAGIRKDAVEWYDRNQPSGSQTRGDPSLLKTHQAALTERERRVLQTFLRQELGELAATYLAPWQTTLTSGAEGRPSG
ncbi:hypothetical protein [Aestuariivirga sp.]|uniref:hypothetical protein n=1 Tax=Aestuariivirga sp. TaxID=2650926 RepID=UPI003783F892